jgi:hypothetical protein
LESTLQNPFSHRQRATKEPVPAVLVKVKLADLAGNAVAFKPVAFSVKTFFGTLSLGSRPTGADGIAKLKITDRRFGTYTVQASFAGDEQAGPSSGSAEVSSRPRPEPSLPGEGVLITPYPTFAISLPFALFFGTMWIIFAYVAYTVWRVRRAGTARVMNDLHESFPTVSGQPQPLGARSHGH